MDLAEAVSESAHEVARVGEGPYTAVASLTRGRVMYYAIPEQLRKNFGASATPLDSPRHTSSDLGLFSRCAAMNRSVSVGSGTSSTHSIRNPRKWSSTTPTSRLHVRRLGMHHVNRLNALLTKWRVASDADQGLCGVRVRQDTERRLRRCL